MIKIRPNVIKMTEAPKMYDVKGLNDLEDAYYAIGDEVADMMRPN